MQRVAALWARRASWWIAVALLATGAVVLGWDVFRSWQLRHSYDRLMAPGRRDLGMFFSKELLLEQKAEVRQWIAEDFLDDIPVRSARSIRLTRQVFLLSEFAEDEDVELLWRRAEIGFPLRRADDDTERTMQFNCAAALVTALRGTYIVRSGNEEHGVAMFRHELTQRHLAPEVRERCGALLEGREASTPEDGPPEAGGDEQGRDNN